MKMSVGSKLLYIMLKEKQEKEGINFCVSLNEMAEMLNVTKSTVVRYKKCLLESGLLKETHKTREDGGKGTNTYEVLD